MIKVAVQILIRVFLIRKSWTITLYNRRNKTGNHIGGFS